MEFLFVGNSSSGRQFRGTSGAPKHRGPRKSTIVKSFGLPRSIGTDGYTMLSSAGKVSCQPFFVGLKLSIARLAYGKRAGLARARVRQLNKRQQTCTTSNIPRCLSHDRSPGGPTSIIIQCVMCVSCCRWDCCVCCVVLCCVCCGAVPAPPQVENSTGPS